MAIMARNPLRSLKPMKTHSYQLKQGQLVEIQLPPAVSAKMREQLSKRFKRNGEDRALEKMKQRFKQAPKPKSLQPA